MRNTSALRLTRTIAKLVKYDGIREMLDDGWLATLDALPINNYYCKYNTKLHGRKWLAPLYRPLLSMFSITARTFIAVREDKLSVDLEYVDASGESVTYTVKAQEWREKKHYFMLMPPDRFRGGLGPIVDLLLKTRKERHAGIKKE